MALSGRKHRVLSTEYRVLRVNVFTYLVLSTLYFVLSSCNGNKKSGEKTAAQVTLEVPAFDADSAYSFLKAQVDFGPRVPGTKAHAQCADYLQSKLKSYGWEVILQTGDVKTYDNKKFKLKNIIASYKPELGNRVLLLAHWDCRPFGDADSVGKDKPIDGANDGASGVAVLLEIARQFSIIKPNMGVDILYADLEDYGQQHPEDDPYPQMRDSWALGTQYWAKNPHKQGYSASYGILLDMVGGKNPRFPQEGTSLNYAQEVVNKVWSNAAKIGYSSYFTNLQTGETIDDHKYINTIAKIPCIDIVHMEEGTGTYPKYHHTHGDNLDIIDKNTLKMVGEVVLVTLLN